MGNRAPVVNIPSVHQYRIERGADMHTITDEQIQKAVDLYNELVEVFNDCADEQTKNSLTAIMATIEQILSILGIDIGQQMSTAVINEFLPDEVTV